MKIAKISCLVDYYMRYGMDRFESEGHNIGANRINEVYCEKR